MGEASVTPELRADPEHDLAKRALLAHLLQELTAPAASMLGYAELLLDEARLDHAGDPLLDDLGRIHVAARSLAEMVAGFAERRGTTGADDQEGFRARLRHDLRTPLNAIKGYGEMLLEDAAESGFHQNMVDDLTRLVAIADSLLITIGDLTAADPAATLTQGGDEARAREIVATLLRDLGPPDGLVRETPTGRILVIDDNRDNRDVLSRRLARDGHMVVVAADGRTALSLLDEQPFDLVLLDLIMPEMSGIEVLSRLKAQPATAGLPVIMISSLDEVDSVVRCIATGAEDYLAKPFNPVLLRARIEACLEKKRLRDVERQFIERVERDLALAGQLQISALPEAFPDIAGVVGHGLMIPAREVGGDLYEFIPLADGRLGVAVGDVAGKGIPGALFMTMTCALLRMTAELGLSPGECLARLNDALSFRNNQMMFVTLIYAILDRRNGRLTYASGGHPPPFLLRHEGRVECCPPEAGGPPLGFQPGARFAEHTLEFGEGDSLLLYSDGVTEAFDGEGRMFGDDRLYRLLASGHHGPPERLADVVLEAVQAFAHGAPQADDITCVAVGFVPIGTQGQYPPKES